MSSSVLQRAEWKIFRKRRIKRLRNTDFSLISSNCNGGIILHDLELKFNTPTVNSGFYLEDIVKFSNNPKHYLETDIIKVGEVNDYFYGKIDDIAVRFTHVNSFDDAIQKWNNRRLRVNVDNMFYIATDRDGYTNDGLKLYDESFKSLIPSNAGNIDTCTYDEIALFDSIPSKNKVIFTHKHYPEFKSAYCLSSFLENEQVGILSEYKPGLLIRRYLDDFDYVSWLNGVSVEELNARRKD